MEAQEGNSSDIRRPETEVGSANASNTSNFIEDFNDVPSNQGDFDHSAIDPSVRPSKKVRLFSIVFGLFLVVLVWVIFSGIKECYTLRRWSSKQEFGFPCLEIEDCDGLSIMAAALLKSPRTPPSMYYGKKFEPFPELPEWEFKSYLGWHEQVGLKHSESIVIRVTGCPNGCARPYMAELGFVGDGPNSYQIWLGGSPNQTSLAKCFMNKVKVQDLQKVLEPLFYYWRRKRQAKESFGNFTIRMGFEKLLELVEKWEGPVETSSRFNLKLFADRETYEAMDKLAKLENKTAHQLAMEVIRNYVAAQ
ncbi:hypothetical protein Ancab_030025 [Ancistrocladus abbreviatus]